MIYLSYYPTYQMLKDKIDEYKSKKEINIFVDLKNCMTGLYMETSAVTTNQMTSAGTIPSEIFLSWLEFLTFHYNFMIKYKVPINIFVVADTGESVYHKSLSSTYKANRCITKFKTITDLELDFYKKVIRKNIEVIMNTTKKLYRCFSTYLIHCESDFVPYYLIKNYYTTDEYLNIVYSSDSDMLQVLEFNNTIIFHRRNKEQKMFIDQNIWEQRAKLDLVTIPANYAFIKAISGDKSDNIAGIKGIGLKKCGAIFDQLDNSFDGIPEFKTYLESLTNNTVAEIILNDWNTFVTSYKLVSFKELIKNISIPTFELLKRTVEYDEKLSLNDSLAFMSKMKEKLMAES